METQFRELQAASLTKYLTGRARLAVTTLGLLCFAMGSTAQGSTTCENLFKVPTNLVQGRRLSPVEMWQKWEQVPSVAEWSLKVQSSTISSKLIAKENFQVEFAPDAPAALTNLIVRAGEGKTVWFEHPYNTSEQVPYRQTQAPHGPELIGTHNASRTMTIEVGGFLYGIKLATDHPFGPDGDHQPTKADIREDVLLARPRSALVEKIDREVGADDSLLISRYVAVVKDGKTGSGYVIRDLRQLQDGHYYLPAHQIPSIGREIAQKNNAEFEPFWSVHYARVLGKLQARQLLRYGFESEPTNPQNYLIQLDSNMRPTGRILYRDITDSHLFEAVADAIGLHEAVQFDRNNDIKVMGGLLGIENNWSMTWHFENNASGIEFPKQTSNAWRIAHQAGFIDEIVNTLQLNKNQNWDERSISDLLKTDGGKKAIQDYHRRLRQRNKLGQYSFEHKRMAA